MLPSKEKNVHTCMSCLYTYIRHALKNVLVYDHSTTNEQKRYVAQQLHLQNHSKGLCTSPIYEADDQW
jgi:hypothetical protein